MAPEFFVDENDLALGKALGERYDGVVFPGHPDLPEVGRGAPDDLWLGVVGERHLCVITRDRRIRYRPVEKRMWVDYRVRGFVLTGRRSQSTQRSLEIVEQHWSKIIDCIRLEPLGPWMYALTAAGIRSIDLEAVPEQVPDELFDTDYTGTAHE